MKMTMKPTENLSRDTEAVADSLSAMMKREFTSYSCYDGYLNPSDPTMVTADDRKKLVDWCYGVVDHCQLSRETVASAMEMVDRFLSMPSNSADAARVRNEALRDQSKFQLLTIAALYSSIKVNERVALSSELFSEICLRSYTAEEIEAMERTLLNGLSWRCNAPTAHQVGLSILSLILPYVDIPEVTWGFLMDEMKYLTELAVQDYYFSTQRMSTTALAAVFNVVNDTSTKVRRQAIGAFLRVIMECFDFDDSEQINAARRRLNFLAKPDTQEDEMMDDEISLESLEESVETIKASNSSSSHPKRGHEGHFWHEKDELGHEQVVSPSSSLRDISSEKQDSSLHFC
ncbi:cyclin family protein [Skeletonema marinoi]|uniref:Cyclin family protein n=1 Tax=Skeletonema marinoi TaxID=267567 RepID=A0AAD8XVP9_9STRA|nr:cyclin family protein [Skeletonema marinoi]